MSIFRGKLETHQIWIYSISLVFGAILGFYYKGAVAYLEWSISPLLAILMYGMFAQIPFLELRKHLF